MGRHKHPHLTPMYLHSSGNLSAASNGSLNKPAHSKSFGGSLRTTTGGFEMQWTGQKTTAQPPEIWMQASSLSAQWDLTTTSPECVAKIVRRKDVGMQITKKLRVQTKPLVSAYETIAARYVALPPTNRTHYGGSKPSTSS